ncbi:MAG: SLBB domain-containing protein [Candidatus Krumholzibacteria bacterium]|nr:SLBB domain-containing protein [Candidatus Krumholzibacteria bacterium]
MKSKLMLVTAAVVFLTSFASATLFAQQDVRLRTGDTVRLDVPQRDDLARLLTVDTKGDVSLPLVGAIHIGGLGIEEARAAILRSLQELYPSVQSISLSLIGEEARRLIYVQGQVARAGKYELGGTPSVWDAIKEAGGATSEASLESVRIIRASGEVSTTTFVNVQAALDSGDIKSLPTLKPGDTVIVPERNATYTGTGAINVFGSVMHPGAYALTGDRRLIDALLAAGGPIEGARMSKLTIIRHDPTGGMTTISVNFERYLETGDLRHNPPILPNDTVSVPRSSSFWSTIASPNFLLALVSTTATVAALIIYSDR